MFSGFPLVHESLCVFRSWLGRRAQKTNPSRDDPPFLCEVKTLSWCSWTQLPAPPPVLAPQSRALWNRPFVSFGHVAQWSAGGREAAAAAEHDGSSALIQTSHLTRAESSGHMNADAGIRGQQSSAPTRLYRPYSPPSSGWALGGSGLSQFPPERASLHAPPPC